MDCENQCDVCGKTFVQPQGLYRHQRIKHNIFKNKTRPTACVKNEPNNDKGTYNRRINCSVSPCDFKFANYKSLRKHLKITHLCQLEETKFQVKDMSEFMEWKEKIEEEQKVMYVQDTSSKIVKNMKRYYYNCHRSYNPRQIANGKRHPKHCGTNKIGRACPATITASLLEDNVTIIFNSTHIGHSCEIGRTCLSANDKYKIAGKLAEGVTIQRVLDDVRESAPADAVLKRIHLLEKKDLHNIKRDFQISYNTKFHENDAISVKLWVQLMREKYKEHCPVLFYKEQGQEDSFLEKNDFALIIMSEFQENELRKYGSNKICVDGTHGLNNYGFQLYTIVVVDGFGKGVPVAFCFSNRSDTGLYELYFNSIKNKIGIMNSKVFMSDDEPAFYNAWQSTMGPVQYQLLCTWHVRRNWFKNLNKITGSQEKRNLVFKTLKVLHTEINEDQFYSGLNIFLNDLENDSDTKAFGEYFFKTYCDRIEKWAYHARKYVGINTNMYLEALHKKIKYTYLDGKQCKRLDKSVNALLTLVRDSAFEKNILLSKNKLTSKVLKIRDSHKKSLAIEESMISFDLETNKWLVLSETNASVVYQVQKINETNCKTENCNLICSVCCICVHSFLCTCIDNVIHFNICKHIHSVVAYQQKSDNSTGVVVGSIAPDENILHTIPRVDEVCKNFNSEVASKCELLIGVTSRTNLSSDAQNSIMKHLNAAIEAAHQGEINFMNKSENNIRRKIEPQNRFLQTAKRYKRVHPNVSQFESTAIRESFSGTHSKVLNVHDGFDHSYT